MFRFSDLFMIFSLYLIYKFYLSGSFVPKSSGVWYDESLVDTCKLLEVEERSDVSNYLCETNAFSNLAIDTAFIWASKDFASFSALSFFSVSLSISITSTN